MLYDISDVCRLFQLSPNGVRHYESLGLISPARTSGGRRKYSESNLHMLVFIKSLQGLGLELDTILHYFGKQSGASLFDIRRMLEQKTVALRDKIEKLQTALNELEHYRGALGASDAPILEVKPRTMEPAYFLPMDPLFGRGPEEQAGVSAWLALLPHVRVAELHLIRNGKVAYSADGYLVHQARADAHDLPLRQRALRLAPRNMKKMRCQASQPLSSAVNDRLLFFSGKLAGIFSGRPFWMIVAPLCKNYPQRQYYYDMFLFESSPDRQSALFS